MIILSVPSWLCHFTVNHKEIGLLLNQLANSQKVIIILKINNSNNYEWNLCYASYNY